MITWVLYLCIGVIVGGMAGFYFAKLDDFSKKQKLELEEKLQQSEQELIDYKDEVTSHFIKTADLINDMTESYQKVHEHLAHGSVELCNNAIEVNKLTVSTDQLLSSDSKTPTDINTATNDDVVTSSTESEAPKTSSKENNNNKSNAEETNEEAGLSVKQPSADNPVGDVEDTDVEDNNVPPDISSIFTGDKTPAENPDTISETTPDTSLDTTPDSKKASTTENNKPQDHEPKDHEPKDHVPQDHESKDQVAQASIAEDSDEKGLESPILETMAVAEEEPEDESDQKSKSKNSVPGSRMVH